MYTGIKFDDILKHHVGGFGKYQIWQYLLIGISTIFTSIHPAAWTFMSAGARMPHRCLYPGESKNTTYRPTNWHQQLLNISGYHKKCERIANVSLGDPLPQGDQFETEPCLDGYVWTKSYMNDTVTIQWSLICDRMKIRRFLHFTYPAGQFLGALVLGVLSDRFGRKSIFVASIAMQSCCGIILGFVPHWGLYAVFRFATGFAHMGIIVLGVILGLEIVGPKFRIASSVVSGIFWSLGTVIVGLLSYPMRDHKYLQLAISIPQLLFISSWWLLYESPRWLLIRNRIPQADHIIRRAAKINNRYTLPADWYQELRTDDHPPLNCIDAFKSLFKTPRLLQRTLINHFLWTIWMMVYYGLSINPTFLDGDTRHDFIFGSILEVPGIFLAFFAVNFLGRKFMICCGLAISGACLLLTLALEDGIVMSVIVLLGKISMTTVSTVMFLMTPEQYPTMNRSMALCFCSSAARAGGIVVSVIFLYFGARNFEALIVVLGILAMIASVAVLFLPETTGVPLMDAVEEAELFGKDQPFFMFGYQCRRKRYARRHVQLEMNDKIS